MQTTMLTLRNDKTIQALAAGMALLVVTVIAAISIAFLLRNNVYWVNHTLEVEMRLSDVEANLRTAESSQRGFLLVGEASYRTQMETALEKLQGNFASLRQLVSDNNDQINRLGTLEATVERRTRYLRGLIQQRENGAPLSRAALQSGREAMDRVTQHVLEMRREEQRLLAARSHRAQFLWLAGVAALAISVIVLIFLSIITLRHARRLLMQTVASRDSLASAHARLLEETRHRELAEAQMRQMQKTEAVGQLTGGIAHDFNNMLGVVIGSLDLARRRLSGEADPKALRSIDNAMEGARRAAQLTARLLAFSRQQPLEPQPLDANRLVAGMSDLLHRTTGDDCRVETVLGAGVWTCCADPGQLENAILNLVVNARDAMPEGGRMTIETANAALDDRYAATHNEVEAGQYIMISVSDTGGGMAADVLERAFDPFFTTKGVGKGTGLGLSQVFGFVKQSQGHVKIYSEVGQGTTVKIYLPRYYGSQPVAPAGAEPALSPDQLPRAQGNETILVVEDEERVRMVALEALRELGYHVIPAGDATQALALLAIHPDVHLLFTDIVMPDINGRKLAEKAQEQNQRLKVLYTTGYTRNAIVHNGMLDPGLNFLAKPFTIEQLAVKVRQVLDSGREG